MSSEIINVSYTALEQLAASFDEHAQSVAAQRKRLDAELTKLKRGWVTDASSEFQRTMDTDVLLGVQRLEAALRTAGLTTRHIVRAFRQAEDEGMTLLDQRLGGGQDQVSVLLRDALMLGVVTAIHPLAGLAVGAQILNNRYALNQYVSRLFDTSGVAGEGFGTPQAGLDFLLGLGSFGLGEVLTKNSSEFTKNAASVVLSILSGEVGNLLDADGDASLNGLIETAISAASQAGVEIGLDLITSGLGTAVMIGNDAHQLAGNIVGDVSIVQRNLMAMVGGDTGGVWYGNMTDSINEFRHQINESDIGNIFDSFATVANDVYFRPLIDGASTWFANPSLENTVSLSESILSRSVLGVANPYLLTEQFSDPARLNQTLTNAAKFIGTFADTGNALVNLPGTYVRHFGDMGLASVQWTLEQSSLFDPATRSALIDFTQQQYATVDQVADFVNVAVVPGSVSHRIGEQIHMGTPSEVWYQDNLSDTLPNLAKPYIDGFTQAIDQLGIDDVMRSFSPIRILP